MKFEVTMIVEVPDQDTLHDEFNMTDAARVLPGVREYVERITRQPQRFTVTSATRIDG